VRASSSEQVRVPEATRLEHLRPVPQKPPSTLDPLALQRRARAGIPPLPRPVRKNQGARRNLRLLRKLPPAGSLLVPLEAGVGQPGRADRAAARGVRGARRRAGDEPLWDTCREAVPEGSSRRAGEGERHSV